MPIIYSVFLYPYLKQVLYQSVFYVFLIIRLIFILNGKNSEYFIRLFILLLLLLLYWLKSGWKIESDLFLSFQLLFKPTVKYNIYLLWKKFKPNQT